jgi:hypothetical protein
MGFEAKLPTWIRLDYLNGPEIPTVARLQSDLNLGYYGQILIYNHAP